MPDKPVSEWSVWEVLSRSAVDHLARRAPRYELLRDLTNVDELVGVIAKSLIDAPDDKSAEDRFLGFCRHYVGKDENANEYQVVDEIAELFGADFRRLKQFLSWKGIIRQSLRRPPRH